MNLNLMLATQPLSLALYHLPALISTGSELTPITDPRDDDDALIDANAVPWAKQWQMYLVSIGQGR